MMMELWKELQLDWNGVPIWVGSSVFLVTVIWLAQVIFLFRYFWPLTRVRSQEQSIGQKGVSVVVSARNEEHNLMMNVPKWMEQDYPNFELIVVNDSSYDDTGDILDALAVSYPKLHVIHIDEEKQNMQGKKFALTLGIKAAKHEMVLLTDADCTPRSAEWIASIVAHYHRGIEVVLGYSPFEKQPGWLNKLIRFDNLMVALHYLGAAKKDRPYMGVGRNLSYTTEAFFRVGGFKSHYSIMSGDDDLLVNEIAHKSNTAIVIDKNSQTISKAKKTWKDWVTQKKRHFITAPLYKSKEKFWLTIYPGTWFLLHGSIITLLIVFPMAFPILSLLLVRSICLVWIQFRFLKVTDQPKDLAWWSPILEVQLHFSQLFLYCSNLISKPQKWN